ncbi:MAG: ABC transporter ATP-binding protein [Candidatus Symbiobacter sp.]|nr:ABC transporter ATP-binding protein [Candidatus Symbiobacter sp.]
MTNRTDLLRVDGLTLHYGPIAALHEVALAVKAGGELVALIGANGAGKSSFLRVISGLHRQSAGRITFNGRDITFAASHLRVAMGICQVPEGRQIFSPLTVLDNIRLGAYRRKNSELDTDLKKLWKMFPILEEKKHLLAGGLSGGQQQMLAMARALLGRPQLLLLDEPSMGLAPLLVAEIFGIIKNLRENGTSIILVEQNATQALRLADRAHLIETGRIVLSGSGQDLLHDKRVQAAYLGGE